MSSYARARTKDKRYVIPGFARYLTLNKSYEHNAQAGYWKKTEDVVGNRHAANGFYTQTYLYQIPTLSGTQIVNGEAYFRFDKYALPVSYATHPEANWPSPNLNQIGLETLQRTNPATPIVSLSEFSGEQIAEIPKMVRESGRLRIAMLKDRNFWRNIWNRYSQSRRYQLGFLTKAAFKSWVWYRFCINPLAHDLEAMLKFAISVKERVDYLTKLSQGQTVKRRVLMGYDKSTVQSSRVTLCTERATVSAIKETTKVRQQWATATWQLKAGVTLPKLKPEITSMAKQILLGFNPYQLASASWELIPWSWLVDWFVPVSTWIGAQDNQTVGAAPRSVCFMRHTLQMVRYVNWQAPPWVTIDEGEPPNFVGGGSGLMTISEPLSHGTSVDVKRRSVITASQTIAPTPSWPALTAGQLSILGSILALRSLKVNFVVG